MKKFFYVIDREILIKSITLTRDESLPEDGYSFFVTDEGDVIGKYCNERAKSYLEEEINKQTSEGKIRKVFLKDYPCFPLRGDRRLLRHSVHAEAEKGSVFVSEKNQNERLYLCAERRFVSS